MKKWPLLLLCGAFSATTATQHSDSTQSLIDALKQDQTWRPQLAALSETGQTNASSFRHMQADQASLDEANQVTLSKVIDQLGHWPGTNDVGENAAKIALILFKRSPVSAQRTYLSLMQEAAEQQRIPVDWYTGSKDYHLMQQNLPQQYGHLMIESAQGGQGLYPIESLAAVEHDRQRIGLEPLSASLGKRNQWPRHTWDAVEPIELINAEQIFKMADLALTCLDQAYPNKIAHVLNSDDDAQTPETMFPAFYGCFDWHSAVHGHWLLIRAAKLFPNHPKSQTIRERLDAHFSAEKMTAELTYFQAPGRAGFERPYGLAWFLQLYAEIHNWQDEQAQTWLANMSPLKDHIIAQISAWVPKLAYPIRSGQHSQTAFAFGLMLDYARDTGDQTFLKLLNEQIRRLYTLENNCPTSFEPSGHDFLSPCLAEADLMRRVLTTKQYRKWLKSFLPKIKHGSRYRPGGWQAGSH